MEVAFSREHALDTVERYHAAAGGAACFAADAEAEIARARLANRQLSDSLAEVTTDNQRLRAELTRMRRDAQAAEQRAAGLESRLEDAHSNAKRLQEEIDRLRREAQARGGSAKSTSDGGLDP